MAFNRLGRPFRSSDALRESSGIQDAAEPGSAVLILHIVFVIVCLFAIISCTPKDAFRELHALCESDAGLTVYQTTLARGYYHDNAPGGEFWLALINSEFDFIEACFDAPPHHYALNEPGCWLVTKISRSEGICNPRIDSALFKYRAYADFFRDKCFKAERHDKPTARYGLFETSESWTLDNWRKSELYRFARTIQDMHSGALLSQEVTFGLHPFPASSPFPSVFKYCASLDGGYRRKGDFMERTLLVK